jgi:DNA-binding GntR family transcriptional regulator
MIGIASAGEAMAQSPTGVQKLNLSVEKNDTIRVKTLNVLREAIIAGRFAQGQKLVERDLCEETGVSRSIIREVLRNLESERLVESLANKGTVVATLTPALAAEIYEVRAALEAQAAAHFAERADDAEIARLEDVLNRLKATPIDDDEAFLHVTDEFFEIMYDGARNVTAHQLMQSLRARIGLLRATTTRRGPLQRREGTVKLMEQIFLALKARDQASAATACRNLINRSAQFAAEVLAQ